MCRTKQMGRFGDRQTNVLVCWVMDHPLLTWGDDQVCLPRLADTVFRPRESPNGSCGGERLVF